MKTDVLGVKFDGLTMAEALSRAEALLDRFSREKGARVPYVVTPNPEIVWLCRKNADLARAVSGAAMTLPDGIGIVYGAKILKTPLPERVAGFDFAMGLMARLNACGGSVFLLGAKPGVAEKAAEELKCLYPNLQICGTQDGYFQDDAPVLAKINEAAPDLLLVCLGAPKQELFMERNAARLDAGLMVGLGGSLDVLAGEVRRAPESWRRLNLEWLYRLIKQPSRIGRMMRLPLFLLAVITRRIFKK
jgi:N-acetylglucosaminyldiphosphoundecaprenol N-acetyl-beta-D-mannosaminyltransferase